MLYRLKELRKEKGISQQTLGDVIGFSQQSINKYENKNIEPDISTLIKIADYFDVSVDYLIGRTDLQLSYPKSNEKMNNYETVFVELFNRLSDNRKELVIELIKQLIKSK